MSLYPIFISLSLFLLQPFLFFSTLLLTPLLIPLSVSLEMHLDYHKLIFICSKIHWQPLYWLNDHYQHHYNQDHYLEPRKNIIYIISVAKIAKLNSIFQLPIYDNKWYITWQIELSISQECVLKVPLHFIFLCCILASICQVTCLPNTHRHITLRQISDTFLVKSSSIAMNRKIFKIVVLLYYFLNLVCKKYFKNRLFI